MTDPLPSLPPEPAPGDVLEHAGRRWSVLAVDCGSHEQALADVCVRCHPYAYGPLCDRHRAEVTA